MLCSEQSKDQSPGPSLPDYMTNCNAVLDDPVSWRHGKVPDYTAANTNYLRGKPPAPPSPAPAQSLRHTPAFQPKEGPSLSFTACAYKEQWAVSGP